MPSTTSSAGCRGTDLPTDDQLAALSERLEYRFSDLSLLRRAMAHRSWCAEVPGGVEPSNERLEFLGDAVLGWVVADLAYRRHGELPEGKLTDLRKSVVNATALAEVAAALDIGSCLLLGKGEDAAGGRAKPSILSDALEAVIGAVYLDGGFEAGYAVVERTVGEQLHRVVEHLEHLDHKTLLQELSARSRGVAPVYVLHDEGPDHEKTFHAVVRVGDTELGAGSGRSKKVAEQAAAAQAYRALLALVESEAGLVDGPADPSDH
jgi:ribonuclease-3